MALEQLAIRRLDAGISVYRCHPDSYGAVYFGRKACHRFDDPRQRFGVCYLALSPIGAFAETLVRKPFGQVLEKSDLRLYCLTRLLTSASLNLVHCHGEGLQLNGLDSRISSTLDRAATQTLSRTLYDHVDGPDGLIYRARHDDDQLSIALFDRASAKIAKPDEPVSWMDAGSLLDEVLDRYRIALIDA